MFSFSKKASNLEAGAYTHGWSIAPDMPLERMAKCIDGYVWSPIVFKNRHRIASNFLSSHFCALDFDDPDNSLDRALQYFGETRCLVGLSRNHQKQKKDQPPCDRFRVVIPWDKPIFSSEVYIASMRNAMREMERCAELVPDRACKDAARFFYPSRVIKIIDGEDLFTQKVVCLAKLQENAKRNDQMRERTQTLSPEVITILTRVIPVGERNTTLYLLANRMARAGFEMDTILDKIVHSPTYEGGMTPALWREIGSCVANGWRDGNKRRESYEKSGQGTEAEESRVVPSRDSRD